MSMSNRGASAIGKTGRLVVKELLDQGHQPFAIVCEGSDTSTLPNGIVHHQGDLTDLQKGMCAGMDAAIFAAGSGRSTGPDMNNKVDRDSAKRLTDLAIIAGVKRFFMLSSIMADQLYPTGNLAHYLKAKHDADQYLMTSDLTYAILRPVALTDDARAAGVILGETVGKSETASRADVAHLLAEAAITGGFAGIARNIPPA